MTPPSIGRRDPEKGWVGGNGERIAGPHPKAQLGIGGQYEDEEGRIDPATGKAKVWTIKEITTGPNGEIIVRAQ